MFSAMANDVDPPQDGAEQRRDRRARRLRVLLIAAAAFAREAIGLRALGWGIGGRVIVRCGQGHMFTTIWIPAASVKSLRFGMHRFQRCPVGRHWTMVTPVRLSELSDDERRAAEANRDIALP